MNPSFLTQLFSHAYLAEQPQDAAQTLSIPIDTGGYAIVPLSSLTPREKTLLQALNHLKLPATDARDPWVDYLWHNGPQPHWPYDSIQCVQISFSQIGDEFDATLWGEVLQQSLPIAVSHHWVHDNYVLLLLHNPNHLTLVADLDALFQTLDDDFGSNTQLFLGYSWPIDTFHPSLFQEECQQFAHPAQQKILQTCDIALAWYSRASRATSPVLAHLRTLLEPDRDLILAMWHTQGTISQAAQQLYLHRNSLQYRLERFQEHTGLSLKDMNSLALCYLALCS